MRTHQLLPAILLLLVPASALARTWTDISGRLHRDAQYVVHDELHVWVRTDAGQLCVARRDQLSAADLQYVVDMETSAVASGRRLSLSTLAYRNSQGTARANEAQRRSATTDGVARLTGWHCYGGHCAIDGCQPHKPCPVPEDKGKRIMKGCYCTFHLVEVRRPNQPEYDGTGAYKFVDAQGCCHQYLELLTVSKQPSTNFDLYFRVVDSTPALKVTDWYFQSITAAPNWYYVFYSADGGATYVYYDTAQAHKAE